jgi:RNA polymerase sigma factor (sigma-70 family)
MSQKWQLTVSTSKLRKLGADMHRYLRRRVKTTADADDLCGKVWEAGGQNYRGEAAPRYYLFTIARRLVADYWKRLKRGGLANASEDDFDEFGLDSIETMYIGQYASAQASVDDDALDMVLLNEYRFHELVRSLALLRQPYRQAIELQLQGYENSEIAEILAINNHTVRSRLHRGKTHLLILLQELRAETSS